MLYLCEFSFNLALVSFLYLQARGSPYMTSQTPGKTSEMPSIDNELNQKLAHELQAL
jgi:hypothetical protein